MSVVVALFCMALDVTTDTSGNCENAALIPMSDDPADLIALTDTGETIDVQCRYLLDIPDNKVPAVSALLPSDTNPTSAQIVALLQLEALTIAPIGGQPELCSDWKETFVETEIMAEQPPKKEGQDGNPRPNKVYRANPLNYTCASKGGWKSGECGFMFGCLISAAIGGFDCYQVVEPTDSTETNGSDNTTGGGGGGGSGGGSTGTTLSPNLEADPTCLGTPDECDPTTTDF